MNESERVYSGSVPDTRVAVTHSTTRRCRRLLGSRLPLHSFSISGTEYIFLVSDGK